MKSMRHKRLQLCRILLGWIALGAVSAAGEAADAVTSRMTNVQHIEGDFSQQRYISVLSAPLRSSGEFIYDRNAGVTWKTLQPVSNLLRIDPREGVLAGQIEQTLQKVTSAPLAVQIFLGLFSGNLESLQSIFAISQTGTADSWELTLAPKDARMAGHIASLRVTGGEFVQTIVLRESNGDRSEIALHVTTAR